MQLDALTTVMKVKASLYIMRGMNTCGTEIYHPYKQSVIGHYYKAELYFMPSSNQNISLYVWISVCEKLGNRAGWNTTEQSGEHSGEKAAVVWGLLPSRGAFLAGADLKQISFCL